MSGKYVFLVPIASDQTYTDEGNKFYHSSPYRKTGVQRIEGLALKLRKILIKEKIIFKWRERKIRNGIRITIT